MPTNNNSDMDMFRIVQICSDICFSSVFNMYQTNIWHGSRLRDDASDAAALERAQQPGIRFGSNKKCAEFNSYLNKSEESVVQCVTKNL